MSEKESDIVYEAGMFYVIKCNNVFETRKNGNSYAVVVGAHNNPQDAERFALRCSLHPNAFSL